MIRNPFCLKNRREKGLRCWALGLHTKRTPILLQTTCYRTETDYNWTRKTLKSNCHLWSNRLYSALRRKNWLPALKAKKNLFRWLTLKNGKKSLSLTLRWSKRRSISRLHPTKSIKSSMIWRRLSTTALSRWTSNTQKFRSVWLKPTPKASWYLLEFWKTHKLAVRGLKLTLSSRNQCFSKWRRQLWKPTKLWRLTT